MFIILSLAFTLGVVIGSFLNVVIYRVPKKAKLTGRSKCPNCSHKLSPLELVPVFSYLGQGRKCKNCGEAISPRYMLVELLTGLLFTTFTYTLIAYGAYNMESYQFLTILLAGFVIIASLVSLAFIDLDTMEIPDRFHVTLFLSALVIKLASGAGILASLLSGLTIGVPMFLLALFSQGLGLGDVKLLAVSGFMFGAYNTTIGIAIGAVSAIVFALVSRVGKGTKFPFGPFLALGMYVVLILTTGQVI